MERRNTYFLSDLHLGARYLEDPRMVERRAVSFLESVRHDAKAVYLLGDILDYWYEYRYVVPKGYVRFFGKLAELADAGVSVTWFIGNHDIWIFDYIPSELGVRVVDGSLVEKIDGHMFFMAHGDGVGRMKPGFRFIRSLFRNRVCQKLYGGIHPRWTIPFALAWSKSSRSSDENGCGDDLLSATNALEDFCVSELRRNPEIEYFIFGHLHNAVDREVAPGKRMLILGEWIETCDYAVFDGRSLSLRRFHG